jgi:hypothetical protein
MVGGGTFGSFDSIFDANPIPNEPVASSCLLEGALVGALASSATASLAA